MVPETTTALRGGHLQPVPASQLVVGDIVRLKAGDKVPADYRVIYNESMKVSRLYMCCACCVVF